MFAPSEEANQDSSRRKFMLVSANVTPATARSSASIFSSSSRFCSTEMLNGSIRKGEVHSALTAFSGARRTLSRFTCADALGLRIRSVPDFPVLGCQRTAALIDHARVHVGRASLLGEIESPVCDMLHDRSSNLPRRHGVTEPSN